MNPKLTANLRADRELRAKVQQQQLNEIEEQLETALPILQSVYEAAQKAGIKQSNYELLQAIGDALTACNEALERIDDQPDE